MEKLAKAAKVAKAALPAGVKFIRGQELPLDAQSIRLVMEGWEAKRMVDEARARLDAINQQLIDAHGAGCALVVTGICRVSLSGRMSVKVADPERLEAVLGGRYLDLVRETVSYKAEEKLIEMATDADDPLQPAIAACLEIAESASATWRAER